MQDKRIKTIIEVTKKLKEKPLILEAEAPFSILAALIDPMKLYLAMQTEPEKLEKILKKIVLEEAEYIKAVIQAGCLNHFFSRTNSNNGYGWRKVF